MSRDNADPGEVDDSLVGKGEVWCLAWCCLWGQISGWTRFVASGPWWLARRSCVAGQQAGHDTSRANDVTGGANKEGPGPVPKKH